MKSNETNFIQLLQSGKEDALEYIVDKYLPLIKGITYKVLSPFKNDGMVDECVNDIFLSIWHHAKDFNGDSTKFKSWVCSIAKFKAIDYYRKSAKNMEIISENLELSPTDSAEKEFERKVSRSELMQLINRLDPIDQQIFIRRFFLGENTEEIGLKLGKTKASIDNRIYRCKKKLKVHSSKFLMGGSLV
ncbi:sigma-70 family RNA polymerase sigma factor [Psychrobacillus antarcticus]|uniref:sigma-70 family RNA polymerase sigma factor n=1 Tax=Psychrobacillus antarcticus TaxID=2879115 RepID=UPI002407F11D|nr:sigma-70 family RNA polymerase sigma factor [Psychrobacillus antarcticus]